MIFYKVGCLSVRFDILLLRTFLKRSLYTSILTMVYRLNGGKRKRTVKWVQSERKRLCGLFGCEPNVPAFSWRTEELNGGQPASGKRVESGATPIQRGSANHSTATLRTFRSRQCYVLSCISVSGVYAIMIIGYIRKGRNRNPIQTAL
jgi:hypothetical protein